MRRHLKHLEMYAQILDYNENVCHSDKAIKKWKNGTHNRAIWQLVKASDSVQVLRLSIFCLTILFYSFSSRFLLSNLTFNFELKWLAFIILSRGDCTSNALLVIVI